MEFATNKVRRFNQVEGLRQAERQQAVQYLTAQLKQNLACVCALVYIGTQRASHTLRAHSAIPLCKPRTQLLGA